MVMEPEVELQNLGDLGRYKVRVVQSNKGPRLDVREYLEKDNFTGFTRKGIRLDREQAAELGRRIVQALKAGL